MRRDLTIKTGNLAGTSDFRVVAPIKKGFVPSLDAMTYKTRVKRVLRTLHIGRSGAFEYELARVLSDAVQRVGKIHSVSIAVLEPEDKVLLTVTFDGAWEAYVRVIWQKVARLLDLVFCNTEGYVLGYESSYEKWGAWLKQAQTEASFLYATPGLTVDDTRYLQMEERVYRRESGDDAEQRVTRIRIPTAEEIAERCIFGKPIGTDPTNAGLGEALTVQEAGRPPFRHGVRSLVGLYRLADVYPPDTKDGEILLRAARELLPEFAGRMLGKVTYKTGNDRAMKRFEEAIIWLQETLLEEPEVRSELPLDPPKEQPLKDPDNIQGGIVSGYPEVDYGCVLLLGFESPAALAALLKDLPVTSAAVSLKPGQIAINIAFTVEGLRVAGLSDDEVRALPEEFVQGMERRAGLLGDVRWNHPRRWRLPARNWDCNVKAPDLPDSSGVPRIDLSAVHAIIQLRMQAPGTDAADPRAQLMDAMQCLVATHDGMKPLSLQWMQRRKNGNGKFEEHFGFVDGGSDPVLNRSEAGDRFPENHVHLGEILCGHPNRADKKVAAYDDTPESIRSLLLDGSFLVVRKLRQDVEALEGVLSKAQGPAGQPPTRARLMAKMMGRWPGSGNDTPGQPLAVVLGPDPLSNDFHFDLDKNAETCPFHAHIRRANPRIRNPKPGSRPARIVRRGMSYGSPAKRDADGVLLDDDGHPERGLIFMAYNASLGEQFEVVQSWLSGGNSSGSYSGQSDPFLGLAESGRTRYFRFEEEGKTVRMALDGSERLHNEPRPLVRLEWGAYFFAPSRRALAGLRERAAARGKKPPVTWSVKVGQDEIARLHDIEKRLGIEEAIIAWKTALEDPDAAVDFTTASIWAAIRECHGGVLRTPFGVLVADRTMVEEVFADKARKLTITAYLPRMQRSFGILYLGLDPDQEDGAYERESDACNRAIMALDQHYAFKQARESTRVALQNLVDDAIRYAQEDGETRWELTIDARELIDPLLADFCQEWFGLSEDGGYFCRSGFRWDWTKDKPPNYPGHFLAPSRYIFQPHPGPKVESVGAAHGAAVRTAMIKFLSRPGVKIEAPVTRAVLDSPPGKADIKFVARTVAGAMMGFIPTVDGNLRRILNEWLREGTLWSLRARYSGTPAKDFTDACNRLGDAFIPAMQLRAVPELIWRTAIVSHKLGKCPHQVEVKPGDIVVAGAISATQQNLEEGRPDLYHAFGGNRRVDDHPTHACPGADPAVAVMLGFFSALVESPLPLRTGPGPLTISLDGRLPPPDDGANLKTPMVLAEQAHAFALKAEFKLKQQVVGTPLLAVGDSWLFDQWVDEIGEDRSNLVQSLIKLGYKDFASDTKKFTAFGRQLSEMADTNFLKDVTLYLADHPDIKALLIGGGGNDVVSGATQYEPLFKMLKPLAAGGDLDGNEVSSFIDGANATLRTYYKKILDKLVQDTKIPILIHAYDHPIPDGRGDSVPIIPGLPGRIPVGPWLQPVFNHQKRGYHIPDNEDQLNLARDIMLRLIDKLNAMIADLATTYEQAHPGRIHPINLTGTLAKDYGAPENYKLRWRNELHADDTGFDLLAQVIADKLTSIGILPTK
jgi:Dyp-type peroxidase family